MKTKRFIVFVFDQYYPVGGWRDKEGDFDTFEEALACANSSSGDYYDIVDLEEGRVISDDYLNEDHAVVGGAPDAG